MGQPPSASTWYEITGAILIGILVYLIIGLVIAFIISFYFSANTVIYALMRNCADNTPLDSVYLGYNSTKTETQANQPEQQNEADAQK
jgi:ABC-type uncharacterized transport system permease subunit